MNKLVMFLCLLLAACGVGPMFDQGPGVSSVPGNHQGLTASEVYKNQWKIIHLEAQDYPRAKDTGIMWQPCDEENSAYDPDENRIHLCTEMSEHPGAAMMFAAHEMAHSITGHYFSTYSEQEADEIGMLEMLKHGYADQLQEAALYYASQDVQNHYPGDPHPPNAFRAQEGMCLVDGFDGAKDHNPILHDPKCVELYVGLTKRYEMMFANAKDATPDEELQLLLKSLDKTLGK